MQYDLQNAVFQMQDLSLFTADGNCFVGFYTKP